MMSDGRRVASNMQVLVKNSGYDSDMPVLKRRELCGLVMLHTHQRVLSKHYLAQNEHSSRKRTLECGNVASSVQDLTIRNMHKFKTYEVRRGAAWILAGYPRSQGGRRHPCRAENPFPKG